MKISPNSNESMEEIVAEAIDEFMSKLDRGEQPSAAPYLQRYPEYADVIEATFGALQAMRSIDPRSLDGLESDSERVTQLRTLGDFRIIREIGRGGMGMVFEAEQISLGRKVALKVLPFAALLDDKQITRFQNEARAAGTLDHPNIVPVYSVGEERSVYYYAMALVDGQNMAEVIAEMRTDAESRESDMGMSTSMSEDNRDLSKVPEHATRKIVQAAISTQRSAHSADFFRTVVGLGIQVAEALQFAHDNGVLHRDIKPANLLLDTKGKMWVTDFGLARLEADAGLTMTGDLLGTLRYMSPKQALGKRVILDQRTDIYSLGITLYEFVALRPPFDSEDRQELLKQIAVEDATPLRKLNSSTPGELETIIHKSICKDPNDRYQSAQEMADDLRRYLEHKPIFAKRPSVIKRMSKWSKRHSSALAISVGVLATVCIILAVAGMSVINAQRETVKQKQAAEQDFRLAHSTLDQFFEYLRDSDFEDADSFAIRKLALLEASLTFYNTFLERQNKNDGKLYELARGYFNLGLIYGQFGSSAKAFDAHKRSRELYLELLERFPERQEYRIEAADTISRVAGSSQNFFRPKEERMRYWIEAIEVMTAGYSDESNWEFRAQFAQSLKSYAWQQSDLKLRRQLIERGIKLLKDVPVSFPLLRLKLGQLHFSLGHVQKDLSKSDEAERLMLRALQFYQEAANAKPPARNARQNQANAHNALGSLYTSMEDFGRAEHHLDIALKIFTNKFVKTPQSKIMLGFLVSVHTHLSILARKQHQTAVAAMHNKKVLEYRRSLLNIDNKNPRLSYDLARATIQFAKDDAAVELNQDSLAQFQVGVEELERTIELMLVGGADQKSISNVLRELANACAELAQLQGKAGDSAAAMALLKKELKVRSDLAKQNPADVGLIKTVTELTENLINIENDVK